MPHYRLLGKKVPGGDGDIAGADEGSTGYTRMQFYLQVASTDEAIIRWSDAGVPDFHNMSWTPANTFNNAYYNRLGQQIAFANSFIDNAQALASDPESRLLYLPKRALSVLMLITM